MPRRRVRGNSPVKSSHPRNAGLLSWLVALPHLYGGQSFIDITGRGNSAAITDFSTTFGWTPAGPPTGYGALNFDGNDGEQATLPSGFTLTSTSLAMAATIRTTATKNQEVIRTDTGTPSGAILLLRVQSDGTILLFFIINTVTYNASTTVSVNDGRWHRLLAINNNATAYVFVDGVQVLMFSTNAYPQTFTEPLIGCYSGGAGVTFQGQIADVAFWQWNPLAMSTPAAFAALDYAEATCGYPNALNYL